MNYVLSERSAQWLRKQMAKDRSYHPAAAAPSRLVRRDVAPVSPSQVFPLLVRFVKSTDDGAGAGDGDFIVYVPAGSVVANGVPLTPDDVPLEPYDVGAYQGRPDWYLLPQMSDGDSVVLDVIYDPENETSPLSIDIYTGRPMGPGEDDDGTVTREYVVATVAIRQATGESAGGVAVGQVTKGPLILEIGVTSLNGLVGNVELEAGEGVEVGDGDSKKKIWPRVEETNEGSIEISLTDEPPGENPEDENEGYCNDISDEGNGDVGNEISDEGFLDGGGGGPDNSISNWPCNNGKGEQA